MPFKLTTHHPITFPIPPGQGDAQIELYRELLRMTGNPDVPTVGMKVESDERAFVDIVDVNTWLERTFGATVLFDPITTHPDQRVDTHTASGDPLYVRLQRVTTTDLRGPWLTAGRKYTMRELAHEWNTWDDHPGAWINDPDPQGTNS